MIESDAVSLFSVSSGSINANVLQRFTMSYAWYGTNSKDYVINMSRNLRHVLFNALFVAYVCRDMGPQGYGMTMAGSAKPSQEMLAVLATLATPPCRHHRSITRHESELLLNTRTCLVPCC